MIRALLTRGFIVRFRLDPAGLFDIRARDSNRCGCRADSEGLQSLLII